LLPELQHSIVIAGKCGAKDLRKRHDDALAKQKAARLRSEEIKHKYQLASTKEQHIEALDHFEHYNSERCWKTATTALRTYDQLKSETAMINAIKEQISICRKGFGWEDAGHHWSNDRSTFTSMQLLPHLLNIVLPTETERQIPSEPPFNFPEALDRLQLGTSMELELIIVLML